MTRTDGKPVDLPLSVGYDPFRKRLTGGSMSREFQQAALALVLGVALSAASPASASVVTVANEAGGWVLRVDGQPFFVHGIGYSAERVGQDPGNATLRDWATYDFNGNGINDPSRESFVDINRNNVRDANEPAFGDWSLLRDMGVNAIRVYHHASNDPTVQAGYTNASLLNQYNHAPNKEVFRDLFANQGIRVAMGDFLGAYNVGSGATTTTDYTNAGQRAQIIASVRQMVVDFKDEPWLLSYVIGNENNFDALTFGNANANPAAFAGLVGDAVELIHSLDPNHPVSLSIGDDGGAVLPQIGALAANRQPDIIGTNVYRYPTYESIYPVIAAQVAKPVLFLEYGDPATQFIAGDIDETRQASVYKEALDDIDNNAAGAAGQDTSIGGFAFTWLDNWWQSGAPTTHTIRDTTLTPGNDFQNEWHGVASQGNGAFSPLLRQLRTVYFDYQTRWVGGSHFIGTGGGSVIFKDVNGISTYSFPAGTFSSSATVVVSSLFSFTPGDNSALNMTPTGVGFSLSEVSGQQPSRSVTIDFPFPHLGRGYVLARFDAARGAWVPLPTRRDAPGYLIAETNHFSQFQVFQAVASPTVDNAIAFPNPARPALGQTTITFTQLPAGAHLKLFTASGELVRELFADAAGIATWDLRNHDGRDAASGVYFTVMDGDGGPRTLKVAVQR